MDAAPLSMPEQPPGARRLDVVIQTLNVHDLLAWVGDPTWDEWDRQRMAEELLRRRAAQVQVVREAIDRVLRRPLA